MRATVQRDYARVVDHLIQDDEGMRRLDHLIVVVVGAGHHGRTGTVQQDAALSHRTILGAVGGVQASGLFHLFSTLLCQRRQRRNAAIGGIDDQRGSKSLGDAGSAVPPEIVVGARHVGVGSGAVTLVLVVLFNRPLEVGGGFLFGEECFVWEIGGSLQRREDRVGPDAL